MQVIYKEQLLAHKFYADFLCFALNIIVEIKPTDKGISMIMFAQILNYLRVSGCLVGIILNFGKKRLEYKRLVDIGIRKICVYFVFICVQEKNLWQPLPR